MLNLENRYRRLSEALICLSAVGFLSIFAACSTEPVGERIDFEAAREFEPFKLRTIDGEDRTLSDFLNKATLVSFFFPTCSACNEELPHFQKLYEKYREQGFAMVAVNVIPTQDGLVPEWLESHGFTFPVLVGADTDHLIETYHLEATPLSFLLNSEGKVLSRLEGYQPGSERRVESRVRQVLGLE